MSQNSAAGERAPLPRSAGYSNGRVRRTQILDAAAQLFVEGGSRGVSLRDVAAAVGITHQGLLRHFTSTGAILIALLERYEDENRAWLRALSLPTRGRSVIPAVAEHNAATPGYVALFTSVSGEATAPTHPAHAYFHDRYETVSADVGPDALESLVILAGWDGLQLQWLYEPDRIDVPGLLRQRLGQPTGGTLPSSLISNQGEPLPEFADEASGYQTGRATRREIVAHATDLFSLSGFHATSLAKVAARAGVSKSTLLHHFPTKDCLLVAVLQAREATRQDAVQKVLTLPPRERLLGLIALAGEERHEPELMRMHCVLVGECASPRHPGHDYFRRRLASFRQVAINTFVDLIAEGAIPTDTDPALEGAWLTAWLEGLNFQWLYHPQRTDFDAIAARAVTHLGLT